MFVENLNHYVTTPIDLSFILSINVLYMTNFKFNKVPVVVMFMYLCMPLAGKPQSILTKVKNRVENSATQKILNETDKAVNRGINKAVESAATSKPAKQDTKSESPAQEQDTITANTQQSISAFSKYDFIPGDSVLYANDFSNEAIGELPTGWNSNKSTVVVGLEGTSGKWLRLSQNSVVLTDNEQLFGQDFTVEFDLILQIDFKGWMAPSFQFGLLASGTEPPGSNKLLSDPKGEKSFHLEISPLADAGNLNLESYEKYIRYFNSAPERNSLVKNWYRRPVRVAIQGQKERLRIWVDGEKLYDVPKGIPKNGNLNQLFFRLGSSPYQDAQIGVFISNIKIAKGIADTRHKLIEEGKFATTGILFESGSASIKPESTGVLKTIANVLKQHPGIHIRIIGHTDDVGDDNSNLSLSIRRADAVKAWLVSEADIDSAMVQTEGKGESEPVADNGTAAGRAQNRRVEFIKL